jgi:hypothetical protein
LHEIFIDCSKYFRNSFFKVGNAELSNKMVTYTTDQKVFIKYFHSSGCSCVTVGVAPSRDTNYGIVKEFEETESLCNKGGKVLKSSACARVEQAVGAAR